MNNPAPTPPDTTTDTEASPREWYVHLSVMTSCPTDVVRVVETLTRVQCGLTLEGVSASLSTGIVDTYTDE